MRVIAKSAIKEFLQKDSSYADAEEPLNSWYHHVAKADWATPTELKAQFKNASTLRDGRAVFNIAGNKYRVVVWINYAYRVLYIRFIGTHKQYDEIDAQAV